jgi:hypothetical protein
MPGDRRTGMSRCVRTSASSDSRWDKRASRTSRSRSSASTWETRASASASFNCPVGRIPGDATGQSRCKLAGSTSRCAYTMVVAPLKPTHGCQHSKRRAKPKDLPLKVEISRREAGPSHTNQNRTVGASFDLPARRLFIVITKESQNIKFLPEQCDRQAGKTLL